MSSDAPLLRPDYEHKTIHWEDYQKPAMKGMIATGITLLVSAVALTLIFTLVSPLSNVAAFKAAGGYALLIPMAVLGVASLTLLAVNSLVFAKAKRDAIKEHNKKEAAKHLKQQEEATRAKEAQRTEEAAKKAEARRVAEERVRELEEAGSDEVDSAELEAAREELRPLSLEHKPIDFLCDEIFAPLFETLEGVLQEMKNADDVVMDRDLNTEKVEQEVKEAIENGKQYVTLVAHDPNTFVRELLRGYGPGKVKISIARRQLVAAYNSGDPNLYAKALRRYEAIQRGLKMDDIHQLLQDRQKTNAHILAQLPGLLANHTSMIDEELIAMGNEVLGVIFPAAANNPDVDTALTKLRKAKLAELPKEMEKFIQLVFEKANVGEEQLTDWNNRVIQHMIRTQFMTQIRDFLGTLARNIRLLRLLFDKTASKEVVFPQLDDIFLESEASNWMAPEGSDRRTLQVELLKVQNQINQNKKEAQRIALVLVQVGSDDLPELQTIGANQRDCQAAAALATQKVTLLPGYQIVGIPLSISDHPFKTMKSWDKTISRGAGFIAALGLENTVKNQVKGMAVGPTLRLVPQLEGENEHLFETFLNGVIDVLFMPVFDGSMRQTDFSPHFERIITEEGEQLATVLDDLRSNDEVTLEEIRDAVVTALEALKKKFQGLYTQQ